MRCGIIPLRIPFPDADQSAVAHVDRNQQSLALLRGNRTLSKNHVLGIDIVVYGGKTVCFRPAHSFENRLCHCLSVQGGKLLDDFHIVKIVLQIVSFYIGKRFRYFRCRFKPFVQFPEPLFNLLCPSLCLITLNQPVSFFPADGIHALPSELFIIPCGLNPKVAAAGMNHQIEETVVITVHFNKMVASAKAPEAEHRSLFVYRSGTPERFKRKLSGQRMRCFPDILPCRNRSADYPIQFCEVDFFLPQHHRLHTAADIDADKAGCRFFFDGHRRSDRAACARMHIRHDPDPGFRKN